jgi:hypothetical protein
VHHQDLRLDWIQESLEKISEHFSLLSVLTPERFGALLSPGVCIAQGVDQDHVLEVDVPTETLIEISSSLAQFPRQVGFTGLGPKGEISNFRDHDLDEPVVIDDPLPDFTRLHSDLRSAIANLSNATYVPNRKTRDLDSERPSWGASVQRVLSE